ncbi:hypothetical protein OB905_02025 [Halobacteria archaeon AArc-dxtr1]|nr:hypothetical protein [Halobacteria archaeon AArc-dxtr1]
MADDVEDVTGPDTGADVGHDRSAERTTAPMSEFTGRDVAVGVVVLLVGSVLAFGVPLFAL